MIRVRNGEGKGWKSVRGREKGEVRVERLTEVVKGSKTWAYSVLLPKGER